MYFLFGLPLCHTPLPSTHTKYITLAVPKPLKLVYFHSNPGLPPVNAGVINCSALLLATKHFFKFVTINNWAEVKLKQCLHFITSKYIFLLERNVVLFLLSKFALSQFMSQSLNSLLKVNYPQEIPSGINSEAQLMQLNIINI